MNDDEQKKDPYARMRERFIVSLYDSVPIGDSEFLYRVALQMFEHCTPEVKDIIDGYYCIDEQEEMLVDIMDALIKP